MDHTIRPKYFYPNCSKYNLKIMNSKLKSTIWFLIFLLMFIKIYNLPLNNTMNMRDWMLLLALEIPLQFAMHYIMENDKNKK
jgi:hypothetical protein